MFSTPSIEQRKKEHAEQQEQVTKYAQVQWDKMNDSEKCGVRFGLFPMWQHTEAETDGMPSHEVTCALLDIAQKNGGMLV